MFLDIFVFDYYHQRMHYMIYSYLNTDMIDYVFDNLDYMMHYMVSMVSNQNMNNLFYKQFLFNKAETSNQRNLTGTITRY